jgi:tetratricopeptide (TPR) repeat protein
MSQSDAFNDEESFQRAVQHYLAAGMHTKRGLTADEYTRQCREEWDRCILDDDAWLKVLVDRLMPLSEYTSGYDYADPRTSDIELDREKDEPDLYCSALALVRDDLTFVRRPSERASSELEPEPPPPEHTEAHKGLFLIALFDVLGFEALLRSMALESMQEKYRDLIDRAVVKPSMRCAGLKRVGDNYYTMVFWLPVRYSHVSDTILLWVPYNEMYVAPFVARCADLLCESLKAAMPLRGALSIGEAIMHKTTSTFLGAPLVEAARLEHAQDWIGMALGISTYTRKVMAEIDPSLITRYNAPLKPNTDRLFSGFVVDWPRRAREHYGWAADFAQALLTNLNTDDTHSKYYDNCSAFVAFSNALPAKERQLQAPVNIQGLVTAVLRVRKEGGAFSESEEEELRQLSTAGSHSLFASEFLRGVAFDKAIPPFPDDLPPEMAFILKGCRAVSEGNAVFIPSLISAAMEARRLGSELSIDQRQSLERLKDIGTPLASLAQFLQALATRAPLPDIDENAPKDFKLLVARIKEGLELEEAAKEDDETEDSFLTVPPRERWEDPRFDLLALASTVAVARQSKIDLDEGTTFTLQRLAATTSDGEIIASCLHSLVKEGKDYANPPSISDAVRNIVAAMAAIAKEEPVTVDLAELVRGVLEARRNAMPLNNYHVFWYKLLCRMAPPISTLADLVWKIADDIEIPDIPLDLPDTMKRFLGNLYNVANGMPVGVDFVKLSSAALEARHQERPVDNKTARLLERLRDQNPPTDYISRFLETVAKGAPIPEVVAGLPPEIDRALRRVRRKASGGTQFYAFVRDRTLSHRSINPKPEKDDNDYHPTPTDKLTQVSVRIRDIEESYFEVPPPTEINLKAEMMRVKESIAADPSNALNYRNLARLLYSHGRYTDAVECLMQGIASAPNDAILHFMTGNILRELRRTGEALPHLKRHIELDPISSEGRTWLGCALSEVGQKEEALQHFIEAVHLAPDDVLARKNLALSLAQHDRIEEAIVHWEHALELAPNDKGVLNFLGGALDRVGRLADAERLLEQAAKTHEPDAETYMLLASHYYQTDQLEKVIEWCQKVVAVNNDFVGAHHMLGAALANLGRLDAARQSLMRAHDLEPDNLEILIGLGIVLANLGEVEASIRYFQIAIELEPNNDVASKMLARVEAHQQDPSSERMDKG